VAVTYGSLEPPRRVMPRRAPQYGSLSPPRNAIAVMGATSVTKIGGCRPSWAGASKIILTQNRGAGGGGAAAAGAFRAGHLAGASKIILTQNRGGRRRGCCGGRGPSRGASTLSARCSRARGTRSEKSPFSLPSSGGRRAATSASARWADALGANWPHHLSSYSMISSAVA
jgi:hypothetical protein